MSKFTEQINRYFWEAYASAYEDVVKYYRPYRVLHDEITAFIAGLKKRQQVLDAGCGTGALAIRLARGGHDVAGVDISDSMLSIFRKKNGNSGNPEVQKADLNLRLPFARGAFSCVVNVHSLFMLRDIKYSLGELDRVLAPGGTLIIAHHKPISVAKVFLSVLREEGAISTIASFFRLFRAGVFNIFLGRMHKKIYGEFEVRDIINLLEKKGYRCMSARKLYHGFDDLIILKKRGKK